jgi:hypothetical protein
MRDIKNDVLRLISARYRQNAMVDLLTMRAYRILLASPPTGWSSFIAIGRRSSMP